MEALFEHFGVGIPMLNSREVTRVLDIPMWRLERFLDNYPLSAGQPGEGRGSRRLFSPDDIRRLAIAKRLLEDGFQPKLVAEILKKLADQRLIAYDEQSHRSVTLKRDPRSMERMIEFPWSEPGGRTPGTKGGAYYTLDFGPLIAEVDQRIKVALEKRGKQ